MAAVGGRFYERGPARHLCRPKHVCRRSFGRVAQMDVPAGTFRAPLLLRVAPGLAWQHQRGVPRGGCSSATGAAGPGPGCDRVLVSIRLGRCRAPCGQGGEPARCVRGVSIERSSPRLVRYSLALWTRVVPQRRVGSGGLPAPRAGGRKGRCGPTRFAGPRRGVTKDGAADRNVDGGPIS